VPRTDEHSVARLRDAYKTWNEEGLDTVARDFWHPDLELVVPPGWEVLLGTEYAAGRDQVVAVYRTAMASIQDSTIEVTDIEPVGDEYVCTIRFRGRGQSSGVHVESPDMFQVVLMEDGLVRRIRWFADAAAAREAAAAGS
jgi:ketosteroid isomerase-like protein